MSTDTITLAQSSIFDSSSVFVEQVMEAASVRLVTITDDAPLLDAARLLRAGTDLLVVCGPSGTIVGVITKTDARDAHGALPQEVKYEEFLLRGYVMGVGYH